MFLTTWDEFEKAAQNIYLNDPDKVTMSNLYTDSKFTTALHQRLTNKIYRLPGKDLVIRQK